MSRRLQPKRCYIFNTKPELYARWRNDELLYIWFQDGDTYPCHIGPCIYPSKVKKRKLRKEAVLGWNRWLKRDLLKSKKIKVKKVKLGKVTYQDPCHLGRHSKEYAAPREIMKKLGLDVIEMWRSGDNSLCCGAGGGVKAGYPDFAWNCANDRLMEADATGADNVLMMCPFCELNMGQCAREGPDGSPEGASVDGKYKGKVFDLLEVLNDLID